MSLKCYVRDHNDSCADALKDEFQKAGVEVCLIDYASSDTGYLENCLSKNNNKQLLLFVHPGAGESGSWMKFASKYTDSVSLILVSDAPDSFGLTGLNNARALHKTNLAFNRRLHRFLKGLSVKVDLSLLDEEGYPEALLSYYLYILANEELKSAIDIPENVQYEALKEFKERKPDFEKNCLEIEDIRDLFKDIANKG